MRLRGWVLLVAGWLATGMPALAQDAQQAPPAAPAQAATDQAKHDDPNEIVCHPGEPILGSRFPVGRICRTRREWDRIRRDSANVLFHEQMERSSNCPPHTYC